MSNYLAFDLGAESGRALVGTLADGTISLQERHRFANPTGRINPHFHWNLLAQWEELKTGLRKTAGIKLAGIGVDTWGVDFGLLGRGGEILGNPFHYRDSRTDGMMERAFARVSREEIFKSTGIQFMQLNSLFQLFAMRESKSPLLDAAETLLFMPDLFNFLFTGVRKSEFSIATTSQMFNPRKRAWAEELLHELELPRQILPTVVPSGTVVSPMRKEVAAECRMNTVPVIAPGNLMFYRGTKTFPQWDGSGFVSGMASMSLVRILFDGKGGAKTAERWDVGKRIRDVAQGPDGSVWMLEDANPGALIHVTPK